MYLALVGFDSAAKRNMKINDFKFFLVKTEVCSNENRVSISDL